jgi:hypothetical protein
MRTSSFSQALIKIYNALYFAQSIQLSNIVLASLRWLTRLCRYGPYSLQIMHESEVPPTQCSAPKRLSSNRDTESVVVLAPNVGMQFSVASSQN